jgi:D-alanine-D-alanine ligase
MKHKRVAVLRGGPSDEYEVSMITGRAVLDALNALDYSVKDVVVSRKGEWLECGRVRTPSQALLGVDVVFIALHGAYGEDGTVQRILEHLRLPFTGSNSFPSAFAFNKELTKTALKAHDILMAPHRRVNRKDVPDEEAANILSEEIADSFGPEYIVKPVASGSSIDTHYVRDRAFLPTALLQTLSRHKQALVEEYIRGREATCGVLAGYRGEPIYALPVVEIVPPSNAAFFTYDVKYNGATEEICPGRFSYREKSALAEAATLVHEALGLSQYSRSDFIVRNGKPYFLEVNTLPGLTLESLFPKAMKAVGGSLNELVEHLVETARC